MRFAALLVAAAAFSPPVVAYETSIGGFIPFVGMGLTDEFKDGGLDATFFLADPENSLVGTPLTGGAQPYYDLALLDTGAATHIFTPQAAGPGGWDIDGNGFDGTNIQRVGGATGFIDLQINDPLAIFAAGLADRTSAGATLQMDPAAFRGQSSVATLSAPSEWTLPNILGLPMAAHHAIHIKNSLPQIFQYQGRTVRTPQVDFIDPGAGAEQGILRRTNLRLRPGAAFIAGPLYVQGFDFFGGSLDFHEDPQSPTVIENAALFVEVDLANGTHAFEDKELFFDTGADLTVLSQLTAKRLGFDAALDTPDFVLEVEGSGGLEGGVPGFYLDSLNIDTIGGSFTLENVPVAVLDVTNPNDPGNIVDGILGMNVFNGRDLVIDAKPSIGGGGVGPSLYISDPVWTEHRWNAAAANAQWQAVGSWTSPGTPDTLWRAIVENSVGGARTATVHSDSTVFQVVVGATAGSMTVAVNDQVTLTTYGETRIDAGGQVALAGGTLNAQFVNLGGGTLSGEGVVDVGVGPLEGVVRNLSGRIEPGNPIGVLEVTGDLSLVGGTLAFDLGGTTAGTLHDQIEVGRFAFLGGTLEARLANDYVPEVGDQFSIISAGEGVAGEFDLLDLPGGFFWDVDYLSEEVVLRVTGIGTVDGDFDASGIVDAGDLAMWEAGWDGGSPFNGAGLLAWQRNYGRQSVAAAVPEPAAAVAAALACLMLLAGRPRTTRRLALSSAG